jgi:hypothetical protein
MTHATPSPALGRLLSAGPDGSFDYSLVDGTNREPSGGPLMMFVGTSGSSGTGFWRSGGSFWT